MSSTRRSKLNYLNWLNLQLHFLLIVLECSSAHCVHCTDRAAFFNKMSGKPATNFNKKERCFKKLSFWSSFIQLKFACVKSSKRCHFGAPSYIYGSSPIQYKHCIIMKTIDCVLLLSGRMIHAHEVGKMN